MKRFFAILSIGAMLSLSACGSYEDCRSSLDQQPDIQTPAHTVTVLKQDKA